MSTEQSLDPQLIEETKQQIRTLVNEIAQLSKDNLTPEEFYSEFLPRVVSALAAVGGAIWTTNDEGRLALQYQVNLQQTNLRDDEEKLAQHGRLLYKCLREGEGMLVGPHSGMGEQSEDPAANPTDFLVVLGPLKTDLDNLGVLEIFQRSEAGPNTQRGYLRFLMQMCELAGDFLKSHQLRHFSDRQVLWTQLEDFAHVIHAGLDPREVSYTIANEGRRLIGCDRVSVAIRKGRKCKIEAISGQDMFDKRSNVVRLLERLATAVVRTGDAVWYAGDTRDMPPQVEDAIQEYIDESHSKNVAVLPLKPPQPPEEEDDPRKRDAPPPPIGALIVEQIEDSRVPQSMVQRVEVVCRHGSPALANALEHENLFLMPLWRLLGKARWVLKARTLPKTMAITGAIVAVILFLVLWPTNLMVQSKGTLEPVEIQDVFARIDGVMTSLMVKHGDSVKPRQLLARLRSTDLNLQKEDILGQLETVRTRIKSLRNLVNRAGLRTEEKDKLWGDISAFEAQQTSLQTQLDLIGKKEKDLEVRSPIKGHVVTWDLENRIGRRPVQRGQALMQIARAKGDWMVELKMPENEMGHVMRARNRLDKEKNEKQEVVFNLATDPKTELKGTIKKIDLNAEVRGDEGNTVLITVAIDAGTVWDLRNKDQLHKGAEVTAKVNCGTCSMGYRLFRKPWRFIQSIIFRYF